MITPREMRQAADALVAQSLRATEHQDEAVRILGLGTLAFFRALTSGLDLNQIETNVAGLEDGLKELDAQLEVNAPGDALGYVVTTEARELINRLRVVQIAVFDQQVIERLAQEQQELDEEAADAGNGQG